MAYNTSIEWTESTWNPWHGCKKVSAGCKFCYMFRDKEKYGQDGSVVFRSKTKFNDPLLWKDPKLVFTCSWSDWFIEEADEWRGEAWDIIRRTPHHTYQILTKRPERIKGCLPSDWGEGYPNVWLGVSIESQKEINRMVFLDQIPAKIKFLSLEPLIGEINLLDLLTSYPTFDDHANCGEPVLWGMNWVIVGGESGNETGKYGYRPCNLSWIRKIVSDCEEHNIPVFVKQLGTFLSNYMGISRHGKKVGEWPEDIRVRRFPFVKKSV